MKIKATDWLLSTLAKYTIESICCYVRWNAQPEPVVVPQNVRRVYTETRPSERKIIVTWVFTNLVFTPLKDTTITSLVHLDGQTHIMNVNITIQSDFKWGEVVLVEEIKLIGAE